MNLLEDLEQRIITRFPDAKVGLLGDSNRMQITVFSAEFAPMSRLAKQQSVLTCINDLIIGGSLHAVTIITREPEGSTDEYG